MSYENESDPRGNGGHLNAVDYSSDATQTSAKQSLQHAERSSQFGNTSVLDAALGYAERNWPVIPLHNPERGSCSCNNRECASSGKHPRTKRGLKDATTDADTIRGWWAQWPNANVGLLTGVVFDVLDIDGDEGGQRLAELAEVAGLDTDVCWLDGPMSITGKGSHLLYSASGRHNSAGLVPKVDWRGVGGYIVAPPSVHYSGHVYAWHPNCPPDAPLGPVPAFVLDLMDSKKGIVAAIDTRRLNRSAPSIGGSWSPAGVIGTVAVADEGQRNAKVHWAAWRIGFDVYEHKATEREALDALDHVATVGERAGLSSHEVNTTIRSGYSAGLAGKKGRT